tara:strand:+ start:849 stop:1622 length:774 start_codon:yes stop_codon:yes gene_type:complete
MQFQDQLQRSFELTTIPKRIISLVPSQTELLVDLGLEDSIVGVTHFCVHPEGLRDRKTSLGGTKKVNLRKVRDLKPDIILCNKEENTREMVNALTEIAPVHCSDVANLDDNAELIRMYGELFDKSKEANILIQNIENSLKELVRIVSNSESRRVAYFIWNEPLMVAGQGTFINEMLAVNRMINVFNLDRYPETDLDILRTMEIDEILLSSEPFPFEDRHKKTFSGIAEKVSLVDGEYFSWYGSRVLEGLKYFRQFHS